jgi:hypothetical protein
MSLNAKKLALCAGLIAGASAPFITGSYSALTGFGEAEFNERRAYSIRASAAAAGETLDQHFNNFLATCQADAKDYCNRVRSGEIHSTGIFLNLSCYEESHDTFNPCLKAWMTLPPSDSFLAYSNAFLMALPTLLPVARDFVLFFALAAAAILCWNPFMRWLQS